MILKSINKNLKRKLLSCPKLI